MRTVMRLPHASRRRLPASFQSDDVRYPEALVEHFVLTFTQPGQVVFDPFSGFGTTLLTAEAMGRVAFGLELDAERCAYVRSLLAHPDRLLNGDARQLSRLALPPVDLVMTSPPYMAADDSEDPFSAYREAGAGYAAYLSDLQAILAQLPPKLSPGAHIVLEAANLKGPTGVTVLAWDMARAASAVLAFQGEVVVDWEPTYGYGYDHSYCLIFQAASTA
jgi:tRNA G10  N-methylase Trm11